MRIDDKRCFYIKVKIQDFECKIIELVLYAINIDVFSILIYTIFIKKIARRSTSRLSFFGFNIMVDHKRVHIPSIGSLAHS